MNRTTRQLIRRAAEDGTARLAMRQPYFSTHVYRSWKKWIWYVPGMGMCSFYEWTPRPDRHRYATRSEAQQAADQWNVDATAQAVKLAQSDEYRADVPKVYGNDGTIHQTGHLDVEVDENGKVQAVWFRCMTLPFEQHEARESLQRDDIEITAIQFQEKSK